MVDPAEGGVAGREERHHVVAEGETDDAPRIDQGERMIRRHIAVLRAGLMLVDVLTSVALFAVVAAIRFGGEGWLPGLQTAGIAVWMSAPVWAAGWTLVLWLFGLYRVRARWALRTDAYAIARAGLLYALLVFSVLFAAKLPDVSRLFLVGLFAGQVGFTILTRALIRAVLNALHQRGMATRHILVVGAGPAAQRFAERIESPTLGLRVMGHLRDGREKVAVTRPLLGDLNAIAEVLHGQVVDEIAICLPAAPWQRVEEIAHLCEEEGRVVRIPLEGSINPALAGGRIEEHAGMTILSLVYGPDRMLALAAKRLLDIIGAAVGLALISPLLAIIAIRIRLRDGGPVLFRQERVGLNGRVFRTIKFRTMVTDAESQLAGLLDRNEIEGHAFKLTDDPRITRTGAFLRKTSLDELPQLWNVLRGEMSLVGPRPPLPREVAEYDVWHRRRLSMKPGITGLWQVESRRESEFDRWVEKDLSYIDRWSLWLDLKILVRTVPAVLLGSGR
jgi:exopolysaccharide biosynthesis polyprenyl glycosylphosphotransferase